MISNEKLIKLGVVGAWAFLISPATEASIVALVFQFISFFGSAVGRGAYLRVESTTHYLNTFICIVGKSARARKGTSLDWVERSFERISTEFSKRVTSGLSSGEGLVYAIRDANEGDVGVEDKRLLVLESEFANVLRQISREGNILSPTLRNAWDGKRLGMLTKSLKTECAKPHVSIVGHITIQELNKFLGQNEVYNGLGNRFLWVLVERSKILPFPERFSEELLRKFEDKTRLALEFSTTAGEMVLSVCARKLWEHIYLEVESKVLHEKIEPLLVRAAPQILRLSAILALLDLSKVIEVQHLEGGKILWDCCEESAAKIFLGPPDLIKKIYEYIAHAETCTRTQLNNFLGGNVPSERLSECLLVLENEGKISSVNDHSRVGRPVERIRVNRTK